MPVKAQKSLGVGMATGGCGRYAKMRSHGAQGEDAGTRSLRGVACPGIQRGWYLPGGWPGVGVTAQTGLQEVEHQPSAPTCRSDVPHAWNFMTWTKSLAQHFLTCA